MLRPFAAGDWFAVPLRFRLFAVGRAAAVDTGGAILGYFFAQFFERLPSGADVLAFSPGDADIIGVCDQHGLRSGEWPLIAAPHASDPRPWSIPIFRTIDPESGAMRWSTYGLADLSAEIVFEHEPSEAGVRNWGLSMPALNAAPMSLAAVEAGRALAPLPRLSEQPAPQVYRRYAARHRRPRVVSFLDAKR